MNVIDLARTAGGIVIGGGIGAIVGNAVKATTPPDVKTLTKLSINIGSCALTGFLSAKSASYVEGVIDDIVGSVRAGVEIGKRASQNAS